MWWRIATIVIALSRYIGTHLNSTSGTLHHELLRVRHPVMSPEDSRLVCQGIDFYVRTHTAPGPSPVWCRAATVRYIVHIRTDRRLYDSATMYYLKWVQFALAFDHIYNVQLYGTSKLD